MFSPQKASFSSFPLVINLVRTSCVFFLLFRITEGGDGTRNRVILIRSKKTLRDWLHVLSVGTRSSDLFATVACTSRYIVKDELRSFEIVYPDVKSRPNVRRIAWLSLNYTSAVAIKELLRDLPLLACITWCCASSLKSSLTPSNTSKSKRHVSAAFQHKVQEHR